MRPIVVVWPAWTPISSTPSPSPKPAHVSRPCRHSADRGRLKPLGVLLIAFDEIHPFGPAVHPVGDSDAVLVRLSIVLLVLDRLTVAGLTSWWRPY
jgi:hypothetical protein